MPEKRSATIDVLKALINVSFTCLGAIFGAAANVPLAGIAAFPPAALAAYEALRESIRTGKVKEKPLRLLLPPSSQWTEKPEAWQALCTLIEQRLPDILERMNVHFGLTQGILDHQRIQQAFIEAFVEEPLHVWADTPAKRWSIGKIIAPPLLTYLTQILSPVIQEINQERTQKAGISSANSLEAIKNHFVPPPLSQTEIAKLSKRYCNAFHEQWKMLDFRGITHVDMNRPMSIPLVDVFVPPDVMIGIPENETLEREISREKDEQDQRHRQNRVREIEKELRDRHGERKLLRTRTILQRSDLSSILLKQSRLIILGDPGSGKSTLLKYLLLQRTDKSKHLQQTFPKLARLFSHFCPVYIPLSTYASDWTTQPVGERSLLDFLPRYLHDQMLGEYAEVIVMQMTEGHLLFLFDGLDEIPETSLRIQIVRAIETLTTSYPKNRFIVTSRIVGYKDAPLAAGYEAYTLADFSKEQIRYFTQRWTPAYERWVKQANTSQVLQHTTQEAEKLFQATQRNPGVRRLAVNPLLLTILALIQRQGIDLPSHRVELYNLCTTTLLDSWIKAKGVKTHSLFDKKTLFKILCPLAFWMHEHPTVGAVPEEELHSQIIRQLLGRRVTRTEEEASTLTREFLQTVRGQTGILVERGKERYGFLHLTFEEYFAARELVVREDREAFIQTHLHDARWREVILLAVGTVGILQYDEKGVTKLLQEAILGAQSPFENRLSRDLIFAGICLADDIGTSVTCEEEIIEKIVILYLTTPYQTVRNNLHTVLHTWQDTPLTSKVTEHLLVARLSNRHPGSPMLLPLQIELQRYTAQIQESSQEARTHLIQIALFLLLEKAGKTLTGAMAQISSLLNSPDWQVRQAAVSALGQLGNADSRVLEALLSALSDSDSDVRQAAASALGQLDNNDPRVLEALLSALANSDSNSDWQVRQAATSALGQLGNNDPRVLEALLSALSDSDSDVRQAAVSALGQLGNNDPRVLEALLSALSDSYSGVRLAATSALGQLDNNDPRVLEALLSALANSYSNIRLAAASALGQLGYSDTQIISVISQLLFQFNNYTQRAAVEALLKLPSVNLHQIEQFTDEKLRQYDAQTDHQLEADEYVDTLLFVLQQLVGGA